MQSLSDRFYEAITDAIEDVHGGLDHAPQNDDELFRALCLTVAELISSDPDEESRSDEIETFHQNLIQFVTVIVQERMKTDPEFLAAIFDAYGNLGMRQ